MEYKVTEDNIMVDEIGKEDKRKFLGPDEITEYIISPPTAEDIRGADWNYSKMYTKCLVEGITTQAEMMDILMRRGIIGPEFEQRAQELGTNLSEAIFKLETTQDVDEKRNTAVEVANVREELFQWNQRLNGPMSNTCEQMADDSRLEFLTSCIVKNTKEEKVWENYELFLKEKSQNLALKARFEVMLYLQGLDPDFLDKTPEAVAMKEVEDDVVSKAQAAMEAVKALDTEEKPKTKTTKKKATKARKKTKK
jgi:hypothetical protein